ncbi:FHA domain-containing serine/threonine-protein kinase [Pseudonocardia adelaidensis]|uniref:non-specific serine/threonine protein kinase n=1 Tax=Pseudonocardia adelaidensis TaxID=648754 RepID=A0ABP9NCM7_9PSEU
MTGANSLDDLTAGALVSWQLAAEAAEQAVSDRIEPIHLLIAACRFGAAAAGAQPGGVGPEARAEADAVRRRFGSAGVDPAEYARRLARWAGRATRVFETEPRRPEMSADAHALFTRARVAVQSATPGGRTGADDLLRALLAVPATAWVRLLTDLAGPQALERLLAAAADPEPTVVAVAHVRLDVHDRPGRARQVRFTGPARWVIGRSASADLRLLDDGVAPHHCLLEIDPPDAWVRDLGSPSGTFVGAQRVERHRLTDGDRLHIGGATIGVSVVVALCPRCGEASSTGEPCPRCRPAPAPPPPRNRPSTARVLGTCPVCTEPVASPGPDLVCQACAGDPVRLAEMIDTRVQRGQQVTGVFGGYTVEGLLGRGGMGAVYAATSLHTGTRVALKLMLPHGADEQRFVREARLAETLRHRHIVHQLESGRWHGVFYIVTQLCEGGSVADLMQRTGGPLDVRRAVLITTQALAGLAYAHSVPVPVHLAGGGVVVATGLVHRDISPGNLLFKSGVVQLADFGLAKAFDTAGHSGVTPDGAVGGKARFVPRQQVTGFKQARPDVDVWSTAACLYHMLTCEYPRDFGEPQYEWAVVMGTAPVPIRERNPHVPAALAAVIDRALVDDPVIEIGDAAQLRAALLEAL